MATKKQTAKKPEAEKTILTKIAGKVGAIAGGIAGRKDHLMEMAGDAIESVKSTFKDMTSGKNETKKRVLKAAPKAPAKKAATPAKQKTKPLSATKKAATPVKKAAKAAPSKAPTAGKKVVRKPAAKK